MDDDDLVLQHETWLGAEFLAALADEHMNEHSYAFREWMRQRARERSDRDAWGTSPSPPPPPRHGSPAPRLYCDVLSVVASFLMPRDQGMMLHVWPCMRPLRECIIDEALEMCRGVCVTRAFKYEADPVWGWAVPFTASPPPTPAGRVAAAGVDARGDGARRSQLDAQLAVHCMTATNTQPVEVARSRTSHGLTWFVGRFTFCDPIPFATSVAQLRQHFPSSFTGL